ncbi:MAG: TerB family tellurite resistance protein [Nannocystaceae bacterium]|nr:TerB family tellurite resistance protein [bacterium]
MSESLGPCLHNVLLAMIIADDDVDPDEVAAAEQAYAELMGRELPEGELARSAADAKAAGRCPNDVLKCLPTGLDADVQEKVLRAAFQVASADGFVLEEEDALLQAVAKAVGMDETRSRSVLASFMG